MKPIRMKEKDINVQKMAVKADLVGDSQASTQLVKKTEDSEFEIKKSSSLIVVGSSIVALLAGLQIFESLASAFTIHPSLGWSLTVVITGVLAFLGKRVLQEIVELRKQKHFESIKNKLNEYNRASSHGDALPLIKEIQEQRYSAAEPSYLSFMTRTQVCQDDSEIIHIYSKEVLSQKDDVAKQLVIKHSTDCSLMVAVSPFAAIDMFLVLWRNLKMLNDIGRVYGIPNSPFSRIKVMKQVLKNMMLVGAQELLMDATFESMGVSLGTKLSARAAQGVGAGLISLRIGLKAIEYCRPVSFAADEVPKIAKMRGEIISQVKDRLLNIERR